MKIFKLFLNSLLWILGLLALILFLLLFAASLEYCLVHHLWVGFIGIMLVMAGIVTVVRYKGWF
jgi:hypothetical protein